MDSYTDSRLVVDPLYFPETLTEAIHVIRSLRGMLTESISQVKGQMQDLDDFKQFVVQQTLYFYRGCLEGKTEFLEYLNLEDLIPTKKITYTVTFEYPYNVFNEYSVGTLRDDLNNELSGCSLYGDPTVGEVTAEEVTDE